MEETKSTTGRGFKITEKIPTGNSAEEGYLHILDMLNDRLLDAEEDVTRAQTKVEVIRDMIHEVQMILNHSIVV